MTAAVTEELSRLPPTRVCCRRAEVATLLRFAATLHTTGGLLTLTAVLDTEPLARRVRTALTQLYGCPSDIQVLPTGAGHPGGYRLRVAGMHGATLGRQTGLVDPRGHPIRGLPRTVVAGGMCDAAAAWRGAFMATGMLTEPTRSPTLDIRCPTTETALALVGTARRLGITTKTRQHHGAEYVACRDPDAIGTLLQRMGAPLTRGRWEHHRAHRPPPATSQHPGFSDANLDRATQAAHTAADRTHRALQILGDTIPAHLADTAALRITHRHISLEALGQLADPPMTKDAIAGRLRRLLTLADDTAHHTGIPDTTTDPATQT